MFEFLKRIIKIKKEPFESFFMELTQEEPSISLEEILNRYIKKYRLAVRYSLDEPVMITTARTKLHILEESDFVNPMYFTPDEKFQNYLETLRRTVEMFDSLPPEVSKRIKEKE